MILFVIFDEKNSDRGLIFLQFFQAVLPLKRILLLMVQVRKVVANGVFFLPLVPLPLVQFSNQKQEFWPMVHSCLWCCNSRVLIKRLDDQSTEVNTEEK